MPISYTEVEAYVSRIKPQIEGILRGLEERLRHARDKHGVPVHLMKWRVKSADSAYLKTKRKNKQSLSEITDFGGARILCIFEQDILPTHAELLRILRNDGFALLEFKIFNWHNEEHIRRLNVDVKDVFGKAAAMPVEDKESGYKSIHYGVSTGPDGDKYNVEIQLRTLLQDVWAEIEHAMAYKRGNAHPHIRKSFALLARDLETDDLLVTHLRDVNDRERQAEAFASRHAGPHKVFWYEQKLMPEIFERGDLKPRVDAYKAFVLALRGDMNYADWTAKGRDLYEAVTERVTVNDLASENVRRWIDLENAYLHFCAGEYEQALDIYGVVTKRDPESYLAYFRMGEILFIRGQIERALVAFDKSEDLLLQHENPDPVNAYRVKVRLANIYWLMGPEYYDVARTKIGEAEQMLLKEPNLFDANDKRSMVNNLCWYQLEKFLLADQKACRTKSDRDLKAADQEFEEASAKFRQLEPLLDAAASSNMLDTAAWYCYNAHQRTRDATFLERAKEYCKEGWNRKNAALRTISSANIHRSHTLEIMNAAP